MYTFLVSKYLEHFLIQVFGKYLKSYLKRICTWGINIFFCKIKFKEQVSDKTV